MAVLQGSDAMDRPPFRTGSPPTCDICIGISFDAVLQVASCPVLPMCTVVHWPIEGPTIAFGVEAGEEASWVEQLC